MIGTERVNSQHRVLNNFGRVHSIFKQNIFSYVFFVSDYVFSGTVNRFLSAMRSGDENVKGPGDEKVSRIEKVIQVGCYQQTRGADRCLFNVGPPSATVNKHCVNFCCFPGCQSTTPYIQTRGGR